MILKEVEYKSHFITIGQKRVTCRTVGFGSPSSHRGCKRGVSCGDGACLLCG